MEQTKVNEMVSVLDLLLETDIDLETLREARERHFEAMKEPNKRKGLELESRFLNYIDLLKYTYFQMGTIAKEIENYSLVINPFERIRKEWEREEMTEEEREQEREVEEKKAMDVLLRDGKREANVEELERAF